MPESKGQSRRTNSSDKLTVNDIVSLQGKVKTFTPTGVANYASSMLAINANVQKGNFDTSIKFAMGMGYMLANVAKTANNVDDITAITSKQIKAAVESIPELSGADWSDQTYVLHCAAYNYVTDARLIDWAGDKGAEYRTDKTTDRNKVTVNAWVHCVQFCRKEAGKGGSGRSATGTSSKRPTIVAETITTKMNDLVANINTGTNVTVFGSTTLFELTHMSDADITAAIHTLFGEAKRRTLAADKQGDLMKLGNVIAPPAAPPAAVPAPAPVDMAAVMAALQSAGLKVTQ